MNIEKHVATTWQVENVFNSPSKVACWTPPTYVPPEIQSFMDRLKERGADPRYFASLLPSFHGDDKCPPARPVEPEEPRLRDLELQRILHPLGMLAWACGGTGV